VLTSLSASLVSGEIQVQWRTPNSPNFYASRLYRSQGASSTFAQATDLLGQIFSAANQDVMAGDTPGMGV